jgi:hypothetical protein
VYTADQTLAALDASEDKPRLYPLEAALAMAAVLRERGVRAMVAEAWDFGEREPPDPTGLFGYFVVAVYEDGADGPTAFFDPWGGRQAPSPRAFRVLRDTEVIAAALGIDAARIFVKSGDGVAALPLVETALSLDPRREEPVQASTSSRLRASYGPTPLASSISYRSPSPRLR